MSVGQYLAVHIHSKCFDSNEKGVRKSNAEQLKISELDAEFIPAELVKQSNIELSGMDVTERKWVLTHGDYGPHNILIETDHRLNILDWEWLNGGIR